MRAQWEGEKKAITEVKAVKQQIEDVKHQMEEAERNYNLEKLAQPSAHNRDGTLRLCTLFQKPAHQSAGLFPVLPVMAYL